VAGARFGGKGFLGGRRDHTDGEPARRWVCLIDHKGGWRIVGQAGVIANPRGRVDCRSRLLKRELLTPGLAGTGSAIPRGSSASKRFRARARGWTGVSRA